jgi:hypothetical protein
MRSCEVRLAVLQVAKFNPAQLVSVPAPSHSRMSCSPPPAVPHESHFLLRELFNAPLHPWFFLGCKDR